MLAPNGSPAVLKAAAQHARARRVVTVDPHSGHLSWARTAAGGVATKSSFEVGSPPAWLHGAEGRRDARGACVVATSGSGQQGPKLVLYRWSALRQQAQATADVVLAAAAPRGGRVRFVAASSVGHAYNLNGLFSALAAHGGAGVCLPASAAELAATLHQDASDACEATVLFATPAMYENLLVHERNRAPGTSPLRAHAQHPLYAFSAGCPLPAATHAAAQHLLGTPILQVGGPKPSSFLL